MMKKIGLKGLRISFHRKEKLEGVEDPAHREVRENGDLVETNNDSDSSTGETPKRPTSAEAARICQRDDSGMPKRREQRGIFKSLRRRLTTNFHRRKDKENVCVESGSSSGSATPNLSKERSRTAVENSKDVDRTRNDAFMKDAMYKKEQYETSPKPGRRLGHDIHSKSDDTQNDAIQFDSHIPRMQSAAAKALCNPQMDNTGDMNAVSPNGSSDMQTVSSAGICDDEGMSAANMSMCVLVPSGLLIDKPGTEICVPTASPGQPRPRRLQNTSSAMLDVYESYDMSQIASLCVPMLYDHLGADGHPKAWSLTEELFKLSKFGWYWGPITRVEAEEKLSDQPDGAFLVRDSSDERYLLSLSFRSYGRTLHTRIEHCNGVFSFYAQPECEGYTSIVDLIEHSMNDSQTGVFCYSRARTPGSPSFPVRLTKPVSRFTQVRTLQYMCRFIIRQYTRFDHIQKLPLPPRIKGWLEQNQY